MVLAENMSISDTWALRDDHAGQRPTYPVKGKNMITFSKKYFIISTRHLPLTDHLNIHTAQDKDRGATVLYDLGKFPVIWTVWMATDWTTVDRLICDNTNECKKSKTIFAPQVLREYLVELILFRCSRKERWPGEHLWYDAGSAPDIDRTVVWLTE